MKNPITQWLVLCAIAVTGLAIPKPAAAQEKKMSSPPPILLIQREFLKPGKAGSIHEKSEAAFVKAMQQANSPTHYIAANSMTGPSRALFFVAYDSLADAQKDYSDMMGNSTLAQALDSAQQADGELLTRFDSGIFRYVPDKSVSPEIDPAQFRFFEITKIQVKLGHEQDWEALAKWHDSVYSKVPGAQWLMYNKIYGTDSGTELIVIRPLHSLAQLDAFHKEAAKAYKGLSADQKKKGNDLMGTTLESIETNLFAVNPKMSYAADPWKAEDPGFWEQK
jgi:hypothetical protein